MIRNASPCTFIESIEWQFLNKWYSVNYYVVTLSSKLYSLTLLASDYRSDGRFADAYNSIRDALARVTTIKVILLLLLNLQLLGQFQQYVVNQLIVCQLAFGTDSDSTEDLIMDISIQCLQQFRRGQTGIHLQERQCNLTFWCKERLSTSLHSKTLRILFYQPKRYRHLSKRKKWFDASKFRTLETFFVPMIKIKLCKWNLLLNIG